MSRLGIKSSGLIVFGSLLFVMLLFPPCHKVGVWREWQTGDIANGSLNRWLNRWYFGYIPQYHPVWQQPIFKDDRRLDPFLKHSPGFRYNFAPGQEYELIATQFTIDWLVVLIQIGLITPFLWLDVSKPSKKPS